MIGVFVGVEHGVHPAQTSAEHLEPQLRRGIDQDDVATGLEQRTGAAAPITGSSERQTAQSQPICGTPKEVPVPRKVRRMSKKVSLYKASIFSRFVVPGTSNGTPAVTTSRSPGLARPRGELPGEPRAAES